MTIEELIQNAVKEAIQPLTEKIDLLLSQQTKNEDAGEIGGVALAMKLTGKSKATIYELTSQRVIPHSKRGNKLYFSRKELEQWINEGRRATQKEIIAAARDSRL